MAMRSPAGFISAFFDPLKNPDAPTIGTATAGDASASVTFTAPSNVGGSAITAYYAVSNPNQITGNAASSPVSVTGLTNGTAYTFNVWALNSYGPGPFSASSNSVTPALPPRGYFAGGISTATSFQTNIDYINILTTGSGTSFGNLSGPYAYALGCSSATRGIIGGGLTTGNNSVNIISYITLTTSGNSSSFGQMVSQGTPTMHPYSGAACSNSTRGIFAGGDQTGGDGLSSAIQYVTIATTGNSTAFGELRENLNPRCFGQFSGCSSTTRGVFGGGNVQFNRSGETSAIQFITIATTGNSSTFGDLAAICSGLTSFSNSTRGIFAGGSGSTTSISYVTIASTGNATAFGTLFATGFSGFYAQGASSSTLGVFGVNAYNSTAMQYLTIDTTGNSLLWGNLTQAKYGYAAMSTGHGGLS